jgi:hypothetical protein
VSDQTRRWVLGLILTPSLALLGLWVGGIVAGQLKSSAMGFDQLASMLGGMMVGVAIGVVIAVVLARQMHLAGLQRLTVVVGLLAVTLVSVGVVRMRRDTARAAADAAPPPGLRPVTDVPVPPDD